METIHKLQPNRTMHLQGVSAYGAGAALWGTSETGLTVSGVFRDAAVLVLWDRDDFYGHPRWSYLPDGDFTGLVLDFDITFQGIQAFESKKAAWTDWPYLDCQLTNGQQPQKRLIELATGPAGRSGARGTFTLNAGTIQGYDRVTLWYQNLAFDYIVPANPDITPDQICQALAAQINSTDWAVNGPVALSASATGGEITITAAPGADGNMVALYELHKNANLFFTPSAVQLSGGSSDNVQWHIHVDFSAMGWTDVQKLWLTFAPALANGSTYAPTDWQVVVSNWTVSDGAGTRALKVAGPGSARIEESSDWVEYSGYWEEAPEAKGVFSDRRAVRSSQSGAIATVKTHCGETHDIYVGTRLDFDCGKVDLFLDGTPAAGPLDCYRPAEKAQSRIRRKAFGSVAAGEHTLEIRIRGDHNPASQGTYYYFDFVECVVAGDVPDAPEARADVAVATDFDTDHTYKCSPQRLVWAIEKSGLVGRIDHYAGG